MGAAGFEAVPAEGDGGFYVHEDEEGAAGEGFDDVGVVDGGCYVVALPVCCCPVEEVGDGGEGDG